MNNLAALFVGFICGIIVSIIFKILCSKKRRVTMIVPRRRIQTIQVIPQQNNDVSYETNSSIDTSNYSISVDETKEQHKEPEELHVRFAENV